MKHPSNHAVGTCQKTYTRIGFVAILALGVPSAYAGQPAITAARLLNSGFINHGTIKLRPNAPPPSGPVPTTITVDTTLNPMTSGTIAGTPISGQTGDLYTVGTNYGVTAGNNEFFSFSTFNVGTGDIAQFMAASNIQNIISRVTGGTTTSIDGTIIAPGNFWFINPTGIIVTKNAVFDVSGSLALGAADYINFTNGNSVDKFYADSNQPLTLSVGTPSSFGFLPNTSAGPLSITGQFLPNTAAPFYVYLEGSSVTMSSSPVTTAQGGSILVIGESVSITDSTIAAPNGTIGIAAVPSLSNLSVLPVQQTTDFLFGNSTAPQSTGTGLVNSFGPTLGAITLTNSYVHSDGNSGGGGVYILGGQIQIGGNLGTGPISFSNGLDASADASTPSSAPTTLGVHVYGQSLELDGNNQIDTVARGAGNTGGIDIALTGDLVIDGSHDALSFANGYYTSTGLFSQSSSAGTAGDINVVANNMTLQGPTIPAFIDGPPAGTAGGPGVGFVSSEATATGNAGNINISLAGNFTITGFGWVGQTLGGTGIASTATGTTANAGNISVTANSIEVHDGGAIESISSDSGVAGNITLTASDHIVIDAPAESASFPYTVARSFVGSSSSVSPTSSPTGANGGDVIITSTASNPVDGYITLSQAVITAGAFFTNGNAGNITIRAPGQIQILNDTQLNTEQEQSNTINAAKTAGEVSITSTASSITLEDSLIFSDSNAGNGGSVSLTAATALSLTVGSTVRTQVDGGAGNAGPVLLTSQGLVDISGSQIYSTSTGSTGSGGQVSISGSGVLVEQQSEISANYSNPGGNPGAPGSVAIFATGATAASDALSSNLTAPTAGVVRIVDSSITATNTGGTGTNNSVAALGQIWIGADLPGASGAVSDNVIIAGSVVSTDVSAGGIGNTLTVEANRGVWIGPSPSGGYSGNAQSLIASTTDPTAASPGQIFIQGGASGITIAQSTVDADNGYTGMNNSQPNTTVANIEITSSAGPVNLTNGSMITAQTTGIDAGGNITISGQTVSINSGTISASSSPSSLTSSSNYPGGDAGSISITSTGADPSPTVASLQISGGAGITSTAKGIAATSTSPSFQAGNAGTIKLTANAGSAQVGVPTDSLSSPNIISTSAGSEAGQAGIISVSAQNITLSDAQLLTTVATTNTTGGNNNAAYAPASVTLTATGALELSNSLIDTRTTGAVDAGLVSITGATVSITGGQQPTTGFDLLAPNTAIFSASSSSANAGTIAISATAGPASIANATISSQAIGVGGAGQISLSGDGITLDGATLTTATSNGAANVAPSLISLNALNGGAVTLNNSLVDTTTSGEVAAGSVTITGGSIAITGGQEPAASGIADTNLPANTAIFSGTGGSGNAGTVAIMASAGLTVTNSTISAQSGGGAGDGGAGVINLSGASIDLEGSTVSTVTETSLRTATPASIALTAIDSGAVTLNNSLLDARTTGAVSAGTVTVTGGSVSITGGPANGPVRGGEAGLTPVSANTSIFSDTSGTGGAGAISVTATSAAPSATGLVAITGAILSSQSEGTPSNGVSAGSAGTVTITASNGIALSNASLSTTAAGSASSLSSAVPATIALSANNGKAPITVNNSTLNASTTGSQAGGEIDLTGSQINISNSNIESATTSASSAGDITITAAAGQLGITTLAGGQRSTVSTSSTSTASNAGAAGKITLTGTALTLNASDVSATINGGNAGTLPADINLNTSGAVMVTGGATIRADTLGDAPGGAIDVGTAAAPVASLTVNGGSIISVDASGTGATAGDGGKLVLTSLGPVTLSGNGTTLSSNSSNDAVGGSVDLSASSLSMDSGAQITANTSSSGIAPALDGFGNTFARVKTPGSPVPIVTGGNVLVQTTGDVALTGAGTTISANATGGGSGGTVTINSAGLSLTNGASIATTAVGAGNSGAIAVTLNPPPTPGQPPALLLAGNSSITTNSEASTGGDITVNAGGSPLTMNSSTIIATAGQQGNGGNITINDAGRTILQGSAILAEADSGNGGAINIFLTNGALFVQDSQSLVSAQSAAGNNGTVTINSPQTNFNSALATPDVSAAKAPELSSNACRRDKSRSTFVREGRGGIASSPDGYQTTLPSSHAATAADAAQPPNAKPISKDARTLVAAVAEQGCD